MGGAFLPDEQALEFVISFATPPTIASDGPPSPQSREGEVSDVSFLILPVDIKRAKKIRVVHHRAARQLIAAAVDQVESSGHQWQEQLFA